jgi:DNA-directed RNA polymerase specialized sigma24 family protein
MTNWELTEESFNLFLTWLDPDRDSAGKKFEGIRRRLIAVFDGRGCLRSDELADEAIRRFIRRLPQMVDTFTGDPIPYLLVTAHHLHLEYIEKQPLSLPENLSETLAADEDEGGQAELFDACLEQCLEKLEPKDHELALDYYRMDKQAKIDYRKELARRLGLTANALRIKVHHLRLTLRACIDQCLANEVREMK